MPDTNANDIDALLTLLAKFGWERYHATAKALVAERNELASRCKAHEDILRDDLSKKQKQYDESGRIIDMLHNLLGWADDGEKRIVVSVIEERDALRKRVAELESHPPASDLRDRLVCAIWPEILRQWHEYKDAIDPRGAARSDALVEADKMLAAMRKGGECNR